MINIWFMTAIMKNNLQVIDELIQLLSGRPELSETVRQLKRAKTHHALDSITLAAAELLQANLDQQTTDQIASILLRRSAHIRAHDARMEPKTTAGIPR